MPAFWAFLPGTDLGKKTIWYSKNIHKIKPPRSDVSTSGLPSTRKAGGGQAPESTARPGSGRYPDGPQGHAWDARVQPLRLRPRQGRPARRTAERGAGGDTNLTLRGSERGARRSPQSSRTPLWSRSTTCFLRIRTDTSAISTPPALAAFRAQGQG